MGLVLPAAELCAARGLRLPPPRWRTHESLPTNGEPARGPTVVLRRGPGRARSPALLHPGMGLVLPLRNCARYGARYRLRGWRTHESSPTNGEPARVPTMLLRRSRAGGPALLRRGMGACAARQRNCARHGGPGRHLRGVAYSRVLIDEGRSIESRL